MNITFLIDNLNAGGAQRQICYLANLLQKNSDSVTLVTYRGNNFFLKELKKNKINYVSLKSNSKFLRILKIIKFLKFSKHDIVISYLRNPSLIAEISGFFGRNWKLIVSERNNHIKLNFFDKFVRRFFHLFADHLIVNSKTNLNEIKKNAPWLKKISLIHNYTDLNFFRPNNYIKKKEKENLNLIGVGKYSHQKNIINLLKAIHILKNQVPNIKLECNWYGDNFFQYKKNPYLKNIKFLIKKFGLKKIFYIHPATKNILNKYHNSSALILPSLYEGFPNVGCEAIACGLPILISNVSDNKILVKNSNGYLFDPNSPTDIAKKILSFYKLSQKNKKIMSLNSRKNAEILFDKYKYTKKHLRVINSIE